jgi:glycosyltransferase involved in cell wall biosynthesis
MRILLVNYRYWVSSGPERYMFNLTDLLQSAGHEVIPFSVAYDMNEPTPYSEYFVRPIAGGDQAFFGEHSWSPKTFARAIGRTFYSREVYAALAIVLTRFKPDVAVVMAYQRKMSPSVLTALRDAGVPCLVRLSDYAMVCAGSSLHRDGRLCVECMDGRLLPGVLHRCVHGSAGASAVNAAATKIHRMRGWYDIPFAYVTPSSALRTAMLECYGWREEKVRLLPTFVPERPDVIPARDRSPEIVYAGRLDALKGIDVLIEAYGVLRQRMGGRAPKLVVAGGGTPTEVARVRALPRVLGLGESIEFRGGVSPLEVLDLLGGAIVSVVPSVCVENLPNSLLESLAGGTPVVASDTPSIAEVLRGSGAGVLVPPGDAEALAQALERILKEDVGIRQTMVTAAVARARDLYSPARHLDLLSSLLEEARAGRST